MHDANGVALEVGDLVIFPGKIIQVYEGAESCNVVLEGVHSKEGTSNTVTTTAAFVEKTSLTNPDEESEKATLELIKGALPEGTDEGHDLVHALVTGSTGAWLEAKGVAPSAAINPAEVIAIAKAICAAIGPVCTAVGAL